MDYLPVVGEVTDEQPHVIVVFEQPGHAPGQLLDIVVIVVLTQLGDILFVVVGHYADADDCPLVVGIGESALTLHPPQCCYGGRAALSPRRGR